MQQESLIQKRREIKKNGLFQFKMEKYYLPRYHIVALTVNIKHGIGSGNDEMIMGNWKIDVRSAEYKYIEIIQTFEIEQIITDILWIYETYPIFNFVVKS